MTYGKYEQSTDYVFIVLSQIRVLNKCSLFRTGSGIPIFWKIILLIGTQYILNMRIGDLFVSYANCTSLLKCLFVYYN